MDAFFTLVQSMYGKPRPKPKPSQVFTNERCLASDFDGKCAKCGCICPIGLCTVCAYRMDRGATTIRKIPEPQICERCEENPAVEDEEICQSCENSKDICCNCGENEFITDQGLCDRCQGDLDHASDKAD